MNKSKRSREQLRQVIKNISSRPPPPMPEQMAEYDVNAGHAKKKAEISILYPLLLGAVALALMILLLAVNLRWI